MECMEATGIGQALGIGNEALRGFNVVSIEKGFIIANVLKISETRKTISVHTRELYVLLLFVCMCIF